MPLLKLALLVCLALASHALAQEKLKIGVPTALTGDAASFGLDIKNALTLMNDKFGNSRYELLFDDEKCTNSEAVTVAQRLINVEHVRYALGFPCNQSLLATASIYDRAGVTVITSSATSGDVLDIGSHIFRLFPSDVGGAELLYKYIGPRHRHLAIITEQTEYPVLMDRSIRKANSDSQGALKISSYEFIHGSTDLRTLLLSAIKKGADAFFVNTNTDTSFIPVVQQLKALGYSGARYGAYIPASQVVLTALGSDMNGFLFANLPMAEELMTQSGKELMAEFKKRYGEPQSGFPVVPITFEAFRALDLALQSGKNPRDYLAETKFSGGYLPAWHFDPHGAVQGIGFQMQKIESGKVVTIAAE